MTGGHGPRPPNTLLRTRSDGLEAGLETYDLDIEQVNRLLHCPLAGALKARLFDDLDERVAVASGAVVLFVKDVSKDWVTKAG